MEKNKPNSNFGYVFKNLGVFFLSFFVFCLWYTLAATKIKIKVI